MTDEDYDDAAVEAEIFFSKILSTTVYEPVLVTLFTTHPRGEWVSAGELFNEHDLNLVETELKSLCWLDDPEGNAGYAVVIFHDSASSFMQTATYNVARLMESQQRSVPFHPVTAPPLAESTLR